MSGFVFLDGEIEHVEQDIVNNETNSDISVENNVKNDTDSDLTLF